MVGDKSENMDRRKKWNDKQKENYGRGFTVCGSVNPWKNVPAPFLL